MATRTAITLQLAPGRDDDLIAWADRIPKGGRNASIKLALRLGLELPQPQQQDDSETIQKLEEEVQQLRQTIARLPSTIKQAPTVDDSRVQELEQLVAQFREWMVTINRRLENVSGDGLLPEPIIEAVPELSTEAQQQRASKLKKAQW